MLVRSTAAVTLQVIVTLRSCGKIVKKGFINSKNQGVCVAIMFRHMA